MGPGAQIWDGWLLVEEKEAHRGDGPQSWAGSGTYELQRLLFPVDPQERIDDIVAACPSERKCLRPDTRADRHDVASSAAESACLERPSAGLVDGIEREPA